MQVNGKLEEKEKALQNVSNFDIFRSETCESVAKRRLSNDVRFIFKKIPDSETRATTGSRGRLYGLFRLLVHR